MFCSYDEEKECATYCSGMEQALEDNLVAPHTINGCLVIDNIWHPFEFCPWCGEQI